jgi:hypothetical protein
LHRRISFCNSFVSALASLEIPYPDAEAAQAKAAECCSRLTDFGFRDVLNESDSAFSYSAKTLYALTDGEGCGGVFISPMVRLVG